MVSYATSNDNGTAGIRSDTFARYHPEMLDPAKHVRSMCCARERLADKVSSTEKSAGVRPG